MPRQALHWQESCRRRCRGGCHGLAPHGIAMQLAGRHFRLTLCASWIARACRAIPGDRPARLDGHYPAARSEEHTSELQSLMRISYAVFCLKKKIYQHLVTTTHDHT